MKLLTVAALKFSYDFVINLVDLLISQKNSFKVFDSEQNLVKPEVTFGHEASDDFTKFCSSLIRAESNARVVLLRSLRHPEISSVVDTGAVTPDANSIAEVGAPGFLSPAGGAQ